jgi:signal-transduction protein with cAMP-binding, CBS, and nucleotidyltransferase domain
MFGYRARARVVTFFEEVPMAQVADILERKGRSVLTIDRSATVFDAIRQMVDRNVGSIIVTEKGSIAGILTERDYLRRIVLEGRTSKTTHVTEVMTAKVICVDPGRPIDECMAIMTQQRIRHLPVMEGGEVIGIVSIGDLVKSLSQEREIEIQYLTDYITGKYPG